MPVCESRSCNAPVIYLRRTPGPTGRKRTVEVDAKPVKVWVEIEGIAQLVEGYNVHLGGALHIPDAVAEQPALPLKGPTP